MGKNKTHVGFRWGKLKESDDSEGLGIDVSIILKGRRTYFFWLKADLWLAVVKAVKNTQVSKTWGFVD